MFSSVLLCKKACGMAPSYRYLAELGSRDSMRSYVLYRGAYRDRDSKAIAGDVREAR